MGSLICLLLGHKWFSTNKESRCVRCGAVCNHEKQEKTSPCYSRCLMCKAAISHHRFGEMGENGDRKCTVCGYVSTDIDVRRAYNDCQEKMREDKKLQGKKRNYDSFISSHKIKEASAGAGKNQFLCMCCEKVLDNAQKTGVYKLPLCKICANKLVQYSGHLVMDKTEGYKRTVTCIKCFQSEYWENAEHQGTLLKDIECSLSYVPGYSDEKRSEADVNSDEGIN